jgi:hypothetical protein
MIEIGLLDVRSLLVFLVTLLVLGTSVAVAAHVGPSVNVTRIALGVGCWNVRRRVARRTRSGPRPVRTATGLAKEDPKLRRLGLLRSTDRAAS